jgi:heme ABC exporter ATP-binding subunit CcmA
VRRHSKRLNDRARLRPRAVPILRLEGIGKRYGRRRVLTDVGFRLDGDDFALLTGPNGSGKTTLLRMVATVLRPSEGRIHWDEAAEPPAPERIRRAIGFVAHQPLVYDELTAAENLRFVAQAHGVPEPDAAARRWLEAFGLLERADERAGAFSRGLRQRLALARAFVVGPRLLLFDEPAASLDAQAVQLLVERLEELRGRVAVLLATHEAQPFEGLATRHLQIREGRVHEIGGDT